MYLGSESWLEVIQINGTTSANLPSTTTISMYLQSIKSVKHSAAKSINRSILKKSRHIGFGVFIVNWSMVSFIHEFQIGANVFMNHRHWPRLVNEKTGTMR